MAGGISAGLAVLAKGLVPLALALPLALPLPGAFTMSLRQRLRDLLKLRVQGGQREVLGATDADREPPA